MDLGNQIITNPIGFFRSLNLACDKSRPATTSSGDARNRAQAPSSPSANQHSLGLF
ncbi:hypothetical protein RchiOBHm_Chr4g0387411 [Rosa chinensis]|uniref:Uncharacterized protein n=1 Tax=Rosa chinensis TaxID=74649 RepID=A0A2P6QPI7_ROSCH|nr:hypothetical protein RchiOBHm_Chr4g0387411 [Rosa chinensis]